VRPWEVIQRSWERYSTIPTIRVGAVVGPVILLPCGNRASTLTSVLRIRHELLIMPLLDFERWPHLGLAERRPMISKQCPRWPCAALSECHRDLVSSDAILMQARAPHHRDILKGTNLRTPDQDEQSQTTEHRRGYGNQIAVPGIVIRVHHQVVIHGVPPREPFNVLLRTPRAARLAFQG
jgi:hypothetical protein